MPVRLAGLRSPLLVRNSDFVASRAGSRGGGPATLRCAPVACVQRPDRRCVARSEKWNTRYSEVCVPDMSGCGSPVRENSSLWCLDGSMSVVCPALLRRIVTGLTGLCIESPAGGKRRCEQLRSYCRTESISPPMGRYGSCSTEPPVRRRSSFTNVPVACWRSAVLRAMRRHVAGRLCAGSIVLRGHAWLLHCARLLLRMDSP